MVRRWLVTASTITRARGHGRHRRIGRNHQARPWFVHREPAHTVVIPPAVITVEGVDRQDLHESDAQVDEMVDRSIAASKVPPGVKVPMCNPYVTAPSTERPAHEVGTGECAPATSRARRRAGAANADLGRGHRHRRRTRTGFRRQARRGRRLLPAGTDHQPPSSRTRLTT